MVLILSELLTAFKTTKHTHSGFAVLSALGKTTFVCLLTVSGLYLHLSIHLAPPVPPWAVRIEFLLSKFDFLERN